MAAPDRPLAIRRGSVQRSLPRASPCTRIISGAGMSSRLNAADYTVARHVADLEAIRVTLEAERVILIGASWGWQLIAEYLAAHPERVERAFLTSPNTIWAPAFADDERLTPGSQRDQQKAVGNLPRFQLAHILMNVIGPDPAQALLPDRQMDGVFETMVQDLDMWAGCEDTGPVENETSAGGFGFWANAATTLDARRVEDPRARLSDVDTPVLVLRGECDYLAWEVTREYRDLLPGSRQIPVDGAGHVIQQDQPAQYRELVRAFLLDEPLPLEPHEGVESPWEG